jgi:Flp pilus assembly secretin CpaC
MLPIIAFLVAAVSLQAQQAVPTSPQTEPAPIFMDQQPIPEQKTSELSQLATPAKETANLSVTPVPEQINTATVPEKSAGLLNKAGEIKRLEGLPVFNLQTNKAPLNEALVLLADTCQMSYIGLEKGLGENVQISVNISRNPYDTMKLLCERYNVALDYENGIWRFNLYNDKDLIARIYHLRYNNQEEAQGGGGGGGGSTTGTSTTSAGGSGGSGGSLGGGSGGSMGSAASFSLNKDVIVKNIQNFLDLSSDDPSVLTADDFDVEHITHVTNRGVERVLPKGNDTGNGGGKGKVIYNSDSKTLYVLATKAQHQWIEKYLQSVDKPQKQILIETKVFETSISPDTVMGVAWHSQHGSIAQGYTYGSTQGTTGSSSSTPGWNHGTNVNSEGLAGGMTALLSGSGLHAALDLLQSDSHTVTSQYPRQVTLSNHSVSMSSLVQVPVVVASTSTSVSGGSSQNQSQIETVPVGINITVLPRIIDDNKILMDISVSSSENLDNIPVSTGGTYPEVAQRTYTTEAIVQSGYTLAIGGLKELSKSDSYTGIPVLSQMPVIGTLFRHRAQSSSDSNLMIFISSVILPEYRGGVQKNPQFMTPHDKDYPAYKAFQGNGDESYTDIMLCLAGMEHHIQEYSNRANEGMDVKEVLYEIKASQNELKLMKVRLKEIALEQPNKNIMEADQKIDQYSKDLNELRGTIAKQQSIVY